MKVQINLGKIVGVAACAAIGYICYRSIKKEQVEQEKYKQHREKALKDHYSKNIDKVTLQNSNLSIEHRVIAKTHLTKLSQKVILAKNIKTFDKAVEKFNEAYSHFVSDNKEAMEAYVMYIEAENKAQKLLEDEQRSRRYDIEDRDAFISAARSVTNLLSGASNIITFETAARNKS